MDPVNQNRLEGAILARNELEAESLAQSMGQESARVLTKLEQHPDPAIRRLVIQVAVKAPVADNCRIFIRRTADTDQDVRDLAVAMLPLAESPSLRGDVLAQYAMTEAPLIKEALARQLGVTGTAEDLPFLRREIKEARAKERSALEHDLSLAAARLGDAGARSALAMRLTTPGAEGRFSALQDCVYVADRAMVRHFGPALEDHAEVFDLSIPEAPPEHARVLDVAIFVMAQLGIPLSFPAEALARFEPKNIEEARRILGSLGR